MPKTKHPARLTETEATKIASKLIKKFQTTGISDKEAALVVDLAQAFKSIHRNIVGSSGGIDVFLHFTSL